MAAHHSAACRLHSYRRFPLHGVGLRPLRSVPTTCISRPAGLVCSGSLLALSKVPQCLETEHLYTLNITLPHTWSCRPRSPQTQQDSSHVTQPHLPCRAILASPLGQTLCPKPSTLEAQVQHQGIRLRSPTSHPGCPCASAGFATRILTPRAGEVRHQAGHGTHPGDAATSDVVHCGAAPPGCT